MLRLGNQSCLVGDTVRSIRVGVLARTIGITHVEKETEKQRNKTVLKNLHAIIYI